MIIHVYIQIDEEKMQICVRVEPWTLGPSTPWGNG